MPIIFPSKVYNEFFFHFYRYYKIVSSSENYSEILSKLREAGIAFEPDNGSELLPVTPVEVSPCLFG